MNLWVNDLHKTRDKKVMKEGGGKKIVQRENEREGQEIETEGNWG